MKSWPAVTLRIFGVLHILMGLSGIGMVVWGCLVYAPHALAPNPRYPYAIPFYYAYTILGLLCLVFLIGAGVGLCRLEAQGCWLSNVVLGLEIILSFAQWEAILVVLPMWGDKAKGVIDTLLMTSGIGAFDELQVLTGYPLIALIATNLAYRRLRRASSLPACLPVRAGAGWKPRPRAVLRALGLLDIIVAVWGLNVAGVWYVLVMENETGLDTAHPYVLPIFRIETIMAVACFLLLIPTGIALWRLNPLAARMSRGLLGFVFAFLLADLGLRPVLSTGATGAKAVGNSLNNAIGILVFIVPLVVYLLVVVIGITIAFRRIRAGAESV
jgi:hypothetical protein